MRKDDQSGWRAPVPVLMYHDVADKPISRSWRRFVVPPGLFAEHLAAIREAGYVCGHISDLGDTSASSVGPGAAFLTFDDGFDSTLRHAIPIMLQAQTTATMYVSSGLVGGAAREITHVRGDNRRLLGWTDIRGAIDEGFEIGSHTHGHLELDVLDQRQLERELVLSKALIEEGTSTRVKSLAYPGGYHNGAVRQAAAAAGYQTACGVGYALHRRNEDILSISRLLVGPNMTGEDLLKLMATGHATVGQRVRRRTRLPWRLVRRARVTMRRHLPGA